MRNEFELSNGNKFYIRKYDVFLAMKILGDVQKRFLGPIAQFMEANDKTNPPEVREQYLTKAIDKISLNLDGESIVKLAKTVLNPEFISVSINAEPPQKVEEHVLNLATDSVYDVLALVLEVLKVNYEDLFTRGKTLIGRVQEPKVSH